MATELTRPSQFEAEWADLIRYVVIEDNGAVTLTLPSEKVAHDARARFYRYRKLLRDSERPEHQSLSIHAELIVAHNPEVLDDGQCHLKFSSRRQSPIAHALRRALPGREARPAEPDLPSDIDDEDLVAETLGLETSQGE